MLKFIFKRALVSLADTTLSSVTKSKKAFISNYQIPYTSTIIVDQHGKRVGDGPHRLSEFLPTLDLTKLDLRLVNDKCEPPIARLFDKEIQQIQHQLQHEHHRQQLKQKKKEKTEKEIRFTTMMAANDLSTKWKQMTKLLLKGNAILLRVGGNGKTKIDPRTRDHLMQELQQRLLEEFPSKITTLSLPQLKADGTSQMTFIMKSN